MDIQIEDAGHTVFKILQKRALLRGLPFDYDLTAKSKMSVTIGYHQAVTQAIGQKTQLKTQKKKSNTAILMLDEGTGRESCTCGIVRHITRNF